MALSHAFQDTFLTKINTSGVTRPAMPATVTPLAYFLGLREAGYHILASACRRSSISTSAFSIPAESRIVLGFTPNISRRSSGR